jgi:hypothetical protein
LKGIKRQLEFCQTLSDAWKNQTLHPCQKKNPLKKGNWSG